MKFLLGFGPYNTYQQYGRLFHKYLSGPDKDEMTTECSKFNYKRYHNLYLSPNIIRVIISIRVGWVWHVARMDKKKKTNRVLVGGTRKKETKWNMDTRA